MLTHAVKSRTPVTTNDQTYSHSQVDRSAANPGSSMAMAGMQDNRAEAFSFLQIHQLAAGNRRAMELQSLQQIANARTNAGPITQLRKMEEAATIQREEKRRENKTGLPAQLKAGIESLSGYAMDDVTVHYNSQQPAQLQAHAYAQGTDIHLSPGQEKHLPHEAWHIVQQKQGRVKPTTKLKSKFAINDNKGLEKEADAMGMKAQRLVPQIDNTVGDLKQGMQKSTAPVQRIKLNVYVTGISHLVKRKDKTVYGGMEEREIIEGQELVIDTTKTFSSRRGPNQETYKKIDKHGPRHYIWYKVLAVDGRAVTTDLYARSDVFVYAQPEEAGVHNMDKTSAVVDAVTNVPATLIGNEGITGYADALNDKTVFTNTKGGTAATDEGKKHAANMGITGDTITGLTGLVGMAQGFKDLFTTEKDPSKIAEAALTIEQGAMKTGEAVSKLVHTASGSATATTASNFGSSFEGFGAIFGTAKEAYTGGKKLKSLISESKNLSKEEKIKQSAEVAVHALQTGRNAILSIKSFIELLNSSGASGGLMAAVPGLDIAVSVAKIAMLANALAEAEKNIELMEAKMEELQGIYPGKDLKEASEFYRTTDAAISNQKAVIESDEKRLMKKDTKHKQRLPKRINRLKDDIINKESQVSKSGSRTEVAEYTLAKELKDANKKRAIRQGILIANEIMKISGSVSTLTGVGAQAGAALKGTAAAIDLALPITRIAKQAAQNNVARKIAKGKIEDPDQIFNISKSKTAKHDFRVAQVKLIIKMILEAPYEDLINDNSTISQYVKATGVNKHNLFKENGNPQEQIKLLLNAISKRDA